MNINKEQQTAIEAPEGVVRILAGPGSGKTLVLTERIHHFISTYNIPPSCILAVSFSVRAAEELRVRLGTLLGDRAMLVGVQTLHALARSICMEGEYACRLTTSPSIMNKALRMALRSCQKDPSFPIEFLDKEHAYSLIERIKQCEPHALLDTPNRHDIQLCQAFDRSMNQLGYCTFQDLAPKALHLLHTKPELTARFQEKYHAVLVDEAQDLNPIQYALIQKILPSDPNLTLVGDDDQGIYSWRGADPDAIRLLSIQYPQTQTYLLTKNYRCPPSVVEASAQLISYNQLRYHKPLIAHKQGGQSICISHHNHAHEEMMSIGSNIKRLLNQQVQPKNIAVLCRSNAQCNKMTIMLQSQQIPVYSNNSMGSPAADQLISLLKVLHKGLLIPECCDIFRLGKHRISKTLVQSILPKRVQREDIPLLLQKERTRVDTSPLGILLNQFFAPIEEARIMYTKKPLSTTLRFLFEQLSLHHNPEVEEPSIRTTIAEEILTLSTHFDHSLIPLPSLISEIETRQKGIVHKQNTVHVLTIHRSKGLEFDYVFIPSVQPGVFPIKTALYEHRTLEEERRLLYVAMTRTKKKLFVSQYKSEEEYPWGGFIKECIEEELFAQSS